MKRETEVKVRVADADEVSRRLEALGADLVAGRTFEDNRLLDLDDGALARGGRMLRLREAGGRAILTGKGPVPGDASTARYKVRVEEETEIGDAAGMVRALAAAGFRVRWRYQKYRRTYRLHGAIVVVDEIPHGTWVEIEGEPAAIEAVAARLGLPPSSFDPATYREIHERSCREAGLPVGDMVFPGAASGVP